MIAHVGGVPVEEMLPSITGAGAGAISAGLLLAAIVIIGDAERTEALQGWLQRSSPRPQSGSSKVVWAPGGTLPVDAYS